ncbi:MAG: SGNH/GDSL hydrolase family protein [Myxococcales bacterium]|nr:MAG: SGNH/GDSL hydrolase family protein [Myxococcales bacterium]
MATDEENKPLPSSGGQAAMRLIVSGLLAAGGITAAVSGARADQWIVGTLAPLFAVAAAAALFARRSSAIELALWAVLFGLFVSAWPWTLAAFAAAAAGLVLRRRVLFAPRPAVKRPLRDFWGALRLTAALFVFTELLAGFLFERLYSYDFHKVFSRTEAPFDTTFPLTPDKKTLLTLGSSPANLELVTGKAFSYLLAERLSGRLNFLFYLLGGVNSDTWLRLAENALQKNPRPDAFIVYSGIQDWNQTELQYFIREVDLLSEVKGGLSFARWLTTHSSLVKFTAALMKTHTSRPCTEDQADRVFAHYAANLDRLIEMARRNGERVFVVTVVADYSRICLSNRSYLDKVNQYARNLPARQPHVTVIDFAEEFWKRYPNGRAAPDDCTPFEPAATPGECGDPYHLGPAGHKLIADMLQPVIERWANDEANAP